MGRNIVKRNVGLLHDDIPVRQNIVINSMLRHVAQTNLQLFASMVFLHLHTTFCLRIKPMTIHIFQLMLYVDDINTE